MVVPVLSLVFHAGDALGPFQSSDGVVGIESQSHGQHVVTNVSCTRAAGDGAGRHTPAVPTRADPGVTSFEVLRWILADIVAYRQAEAANPNGDSGLGGSSPCTSG